MPRRRRHGTGIGRSAHRLRAQKLRDRIGCRTAILLLTLGVPLHWTTIGRVAQYRVRRIEAIQRLKLSARVEYRTLRMEAQRR